MIKKDLKRFAEYFSKYTELRAQRNSNVHISLVKGDIMVNNSSAQQGISARVYDEGLWGMASNPVDSPESFKKVIREATQNAAYLSKKERLKKAELPSSKAIISKDFSTKKTRRSQREMIEFLKEIDNYIIKKYQDLSSRTLVLSNLDMEKQIYTSTGSDAYSLVPRSIIIVQLNKIKDGKPYESYDVLGGLGQFEDVFEDPRSIYPKLEKLYKHLCDKSAGIYAGSGIKDCVLDADLAGILAHEAIGHTTEGDIVKGGSVAGDHLNDKVASELISLTDFAHTALGKQCPVPVYVDDEGTEARDAKIIENGVLKSFMHSKETAMYFGHKPTGNARAYGYYDEPIVRMRNTAIIPGKSKFEDMIASIDDGYYLLKPSNGQADSTSEFMFGVTMGYKIEKGKLTRAIKDTTISGIAFDVLKTVTMVSDDMIWSNGGMCGKKQMIPAAMGGPAIKCKVNIGGK